MENAVVAAAGEDSWSRDRIGNDIIYGFPADQILEWVEETVDRLQEFTADIVLTDLPLPSVRRLSEPTFLVFRSLLASPADYRSRRSWTRPSV